jgi:glycine cleavage system regulatory protein
VTTLVLTVVGDDRVGLVKALADIVSGNGGNWERSHLAELAGTFAGVVLVTVPDRGADQLRAALAGIDGLLEVAVRATDAEAAPNASRRRVRLDLLGNDRPGIVAAVSGVLAEHGLGVADLQTRTREAPMAGGLLFEASAVVTVEDEAALDAVRAALEELATEILVDVAVVELA